MDARLPTKMWVSARLNQWNAAGYPAVLRRRGDPDGGTVIIIVDRCDGHAVLLGQRRDLDGKLFWEPLGTGDAMGLEDQASYLERALKRDRDVWLVAVDVTDGWPPLHEPVITKP